MAWISVHEQVIGGKLRTLAKEIGCSQNEALGLLVRLWLWGINNADKEGRIIGADKSDVAEVLNIGIDGRYSPDKVVAALVSTNWIDIDEDLYIHDWEEWQQPRYKALHVRESAAERKRKERRRKRLEKNAELSKCEETQNENGIEDILPSPKLIIPHEEAEKNDPVFSYTKDFEEFWNLYPRKIGKGDAYKKYKTRLNDGWSPGELLEAVRNYADECAKNNTAKEYIKHPKTFLSDTTPFTDYLKKSDGITDDRRDKGVKKNGFNNFTQRQYDFGELEKSLINMN